MYYLLRDPYDLAYAFIDFTTGSFHGDERTGGEWNLDIDVLLSEIIANGFNSADNRFSAIPHSNIHEYIDYLNSDPDYVSCSLVASFNTLNDVLNIKQTYPELFL